MTSRIRKKNMNYCGRGGYDQQHWALVYSLVSSKEFEKKTDKTKQKKGSRKFAARGEN